MRIELFSRPLHPSQPAKKSLPSQDEPSCRHLAHVSTIHLIPTHGSRDTGFTLPAKRGGASNRPEAVSWVDTGSTACAVLCCECCSTRVRKEGPCPALFSLSCSRLPCHYIPGGRGNGSCQRRGQPVSQPFGKPGSWSWPWFSACVFNTLRLIFSLAPLGPGFYSGISEKCFQGDLECKDSSYFKDSSNNSHNHQHWGLLNKAPRHKCHSVHSHLFSTYCMPGNLLEARVIE